MRHTETGRFLTERKMGLLLGEATPAALSEALGAVDGAAYSAMRKQVLEQDRATWVCDLGECRALVERLAALPATAPGHANWQPA
jgi:succinoglycan biosynthesis protein ExoL